MAEECIDIGSKIVTIAIMMHGEIIETKLSPAQQKIFDNTRLFSLVGGFSEAGLGLNEIRMSNINYLNKIFQIDLSETTHQVMKDYTERIRPTYARYIDAFLDDLSSENICKVFSTITIDKALGTAITSAYDKMMSCILPDVIGIYVISVHEKIDANQMSLIYPLERNVPNLDLLKRADFIRFADIFGKDGESILREMAAVSSDWPDYSSSIDDETFQPELDNWKVTFTQRLGFFQKVYGDISYIRLSYLVDIIKQIVGRGKCKLNLFDYSCAVLAPIVNNPVGTLFSGYMKSDDIEMGPPKGWGGGGRRRHKKRSTRKRGFAQK
jgi:hypothetical protein